MSQFLITSDLHFTDQKRDEYRFGILPWLGTQAQLKNVDAVLILGDLTDRKDNHSAKLVNIIVDNLENIAKIKPVYILKGNHDYIDASTPFFRFLDAIEGVRFVSGVERINISGRDCLFVPHGMLDEALGGWGIPDFVFLHHTFSGALASNGQKMEGTNTKALKGRKGRVYSGDIHVPQKLGGVTYVGSPYAIKFGDTFEPRVLLVNDSGQENLHFDTISKHTIYIIPSDETSSQTISAKEGDQVKIRVRLKQSEFVDWPAHHKSLQEEAEKRGWDLCGIELVALDTATENKKEDDVNGGTLALTPKEQFTSFCDSRGIDEYMRQIGSEVMEDGKA